MEDISIQEAEITGIEHRQEDKELLLTGKLPLETTCRIAFQGVDWWELCSFGVQNVLSSVKGYDGNSLTEAIITDQDIPEQYVRSVQEGNHQLFVLNASIGLSGWIIAAAMKVETACRR
ncbi:hypothetical protein [Spirosoma spitsbergense]|jgi:hypothetical protein|uniref:hypothetical protein n=1 Tax=Spirosoma spitsbergense TaxID=431554 RepID=UPI000362D71E|nr:hypothetical protein [Spirosoma spitsbergense]